MKNEPPQFLFPYLVAGMEAAQAANPTPAQAAAPAGAAAQPADAAAGAAEAPDPSPDPADIRRRLEMRQYRRQEVSTPVVSKLLSQGNEVLGLQPLGRFQLQFDQPERSLRTFVKQLLRRLKLRSAEHAWQALGHLLPAEPAIVVDVPDFDPADHTPWDDRKNLIAALVLGKCRGSVYSPDRPLIWTERRLARSVRLVHCDAITFTRDDHE